MLLFLAVFGRAGVVDDIRKRDELVIATDATYKPFETKTRDGSGIEGFDVDVGAALAKALGVKVRWINQEWSGVLGSLESGKADLVMAGVTITAERKAKGYLYSRPYFLSGQAIARRKGDASITKPEDLVGKTVAVQAETTGQFAVQKLGVPKDRQLRFDGIEEGLQDVANRKSDACVGDEPTIKAYLPNYPNLELVGPAFVKEDLGIVAWKGHEDLVRGGEQGADRDARGRAVRRVLRAVDRGAVDARAREGAGRAGGAGLAAGRHGVVGIGRRRRASRSASTCFGRRCRGFCRGLC